MFIIKYRISNLDVQGCQANSVKSSCHPLVGSSMGSFAEEGTFQHCVQWFYETFSDLW